MDHTYIKLRLPNKLMVDVVFCYLELDSNNYPCREIGFNSDNNPIVFYPSKEIPYGFFSDSSISFKPKEWDQIEKEEFESIWKNKHLG